MGNLQFVYKSPKLWASIIVIVVILGMYISLMFTINNSVKLTMDEKAKLETTIQDYKDSLYLTVKACNTDKQEYKNLYYKSKKEAEELRAENTQLKFQIHELTKASAILRKKSKELRKAQEDIENSNKGE